MTSNEALDALARKSGIALTFNEMGLCRLRFDERYIVDLEVSDDERAIFIYSRLGPLPYGDAGRELMEKAMRAHAFGRETGKTVFGIIQDDFVAFVRVELEGAEDDVLYTELENFLDVLSVWTDELR